MDASESHIQETVSTVDVHAAKNLLDSSGFRYLDVRTVEEYNKSHVENAINIPYLFKTPEVIFRVCHNFRQAKNPEFLDQVSAVCTKDDQLVVACNSGGRSFMACTDLLQAVRIRECEEHERGYSAWVDNGLAGNDKPAEEMKTVCKFRPSV
ncbi:hypothetical protein MKW92_048494 [Papaver armeniacum]|nr:hypothetical protein MKW92_048494 [Papaver armeniacum]